MQSVHLITSTYKDRHELDSWLPIVIQNYNTQDCELDYTIYEKVDGFEFNQYKKKDEHEIYLSNFGRCDYAFLFHIVKNYDNLANFTVFTKSNRIELTRIQDIVTNCHFYDFCESGGVNKQQFHDPRNASNANLYPSHLVERCYLPGNHVYEAQVTKDWIQEIFGDDLPGHYEGFTVGPPCFAVAKNIILRHPKHVYEFLLHKFHPSSNSWNVKKASELMGDKSLEDVGKHFHDCFTRFWKPFFLHKVENPKIGRYSIDG
jgi:Protein of unknown function (DUF3431)